MVMVMSAAKVVKSSANNQLHRTNFSCHLLCTKTLKSAIQNLRGELGVRGVRPRIIMKLVIFLISLLSANTCLTDIKKEIPIEQKSVYGLVLEKSTKQEVFSKFGETSAWNRDDPRHDAFLYCYKLNSKIPAWVVIGFGWAWSFERNDSIRVTYNKNDIAGSCKETTVTIEQLKTNGGIYLGMPKQNALSLISDKQKIEGNKYTYSYDVYEKYKEPRTYPTSDFTYVGEYHYGVIEYQFNNDILESYYIWVSGEPDW